MGEIKGMLESSYMYRSYGMFQGGAMMPGYGYGNKYDWGGAQPVTGSTGSVPATPNK